MSDINKFTTKEVLNKVLLDSSGNSVAANSHTSQEALNAVLDTSNNRLNVSLGGSNTISGDVTITGDLTVQGGGSLAFDEIIEGSLKVKRASAGSITVPAVSDDLVIENNDNAGISILTPDDKMGTIGFGSPSDAIAGMIRYEETNKTMIFGTVEGTSAGNIKFLTANEVTAMTIDSSQNATITGDLTVTGGDIFSANLGLQTTNGTGTIFLSGNTTINDAGNDVDFRVESDTNTHAFFVQGSDGNVGIGTTPSYTLDLSTSSNNMARFNSSNSTGGTLRFAQGGNNKFFLGMFSSISGSGTDYSPFLLAETGLGLSFGVNGTASKVMTLDNAGNIGIGTSSTTIDAKLHVVGNSDSVAAFKIGANDTHGFSFFERSTDGDLRITKEVSGTHVDVINIKRADGDVQFFNNVEIQDIAKVESLQFFQNSVSTGADVAISRPTTNTLAFYTNNGTERLRIDASGDLKLQERLIFSGTNDTISGPSINLHSNNYLYIAGGSSGVIIGDDSTASRMQILDNSDVQFEVASSVRFKINTNSRISLSNNDAGGTTGTDSTSGNTLFGYLAGSSIQDTGIDNTYIGHKAGASTTTGDNNTAIGARALTNITTAGQSVAIGEQSGYSVTDHGNNIFIGCQAGYYQKGESNVFIGKDAALGAVGSNNDGTVAIGFKSLNALTSGAKNVVIGYESGKAFNGDNSTIIGYQAGLEADGTAGNSTLIGHEAGKHLDDGTYNTAIGIESMKSNSGGSNTAIRNTCVGWRSGDLIRTGSDNVVIGHGAEVSATNAVNQIAIGKEAEGVADNSVVLGNADITDVYMARDSGATVHCAGAVVSEGINFPDNAATGHSSDVNTLDNYEEGTWTPVLCNLSATGQEMTMNGEQAGTYVKIGRFVHLSINCGAGGNGTATNSDMAIKNLPFVCAGSSTTDRGFRASFNVSSAGGLNLPDGKFLVGFLNAATQVIELRKVDVDPVTTGESGNTSQVSRDELSVNGGFVMSGTYIS